MTTTVLFVQGAAERAGAERILLTLLRRLDRSRFEPVVAFLDRGPFVEEVAASGVEVVELPPGPRLRNLPRAPATVRTLTETIRRTESDLVQATGEKMSVYAGWAARAAGRPCVFWLHDSPARRSGGAWLAQLAMAATPRTRVIACAAWLADAFARRLRMPASAIHNGIEPGDLPAPVARNELLSECGWQDGAIVFGHFARLQRWKGTEVFLRAAAQVAEQVPQARFMVVGSALYGRERGYADSLPRLASELGLAERCRFTGYRSDALELMGAVDAVVHASLRPDPFPMVVLEAMALGRPLVATRTRGPEEAIDPGRTGLLTDPGDPGGLAAAMTELAVSEERRRSLGAAARHHVLERFTAQRMTARFEELYEQLAVPSAHRAGWRGSR